MNIQHKFNSSSDYYKRQLSVPTYNKFRILASIYFTWQFIRIISIVFEHIMVPSEMFSGISANGVSRNQKKQKSTRW